MRNYLQIGILVNGGPFSEISTETFGLYISGEAKHKTPAPKMTIATVPGRTAPVVLYENAYEPIDITYPAFFAPDGNGFYGNYFTLQSAFDAFTNLLLSFSEQEEQIAFSGSYVPSLALTVRDSYDPEHFRKAFVTSEIDFAPSTDRAAMSFDLTFHCDPRRFERIEIPVNVPMGKTPVFLEPVITHKYQYPFSPEIVVRAPTTSGATRRFVLYKYNWQTSEFEDIVVVRITGTDAQITIDCENQECYFTGTAQNANQYVRMYAADLVDVPVAFPVVPSYSNLWVETNGETYLTISPQEWTL